MGKRASLMAVLILMSLALAGCTSSTDEEPEPTDGPTGTTTPSGAPPAGTGTTTGSPTTTTAPPANATEGSIEAFSADATAGDVPLEVTFIFNATSTDAEATYRIAFGDGMDANGTLAGFNGTVNHTYSIGGNFTAHAELMHGDETVRSENITITATVAASAAPPEELEFSYGESLGCTGDFLKLAGLHCVSFTEGPSAPAIDGFWQPLDERYWGLDFDSTVGNGLGDSDCDMVDADGAIIGEGNNGGSQCLGTIEPGTAWLFIYSYAEPATGMTLTFTL